MLGRIQWGDTEFPLACFGSSSERVGETLKRRQPKAIEYDTTPCLLA